MATVSPLGGQCSSQQGCAGKPYHVRSSVSIRDWKDIDFVAKFLVVVEADKSRTNELGPHLAIQFCSGLHSSKVQGRWW